jgi:hypothetical protein
MPQFILGVKRPIFDGISIGFWNIHIIGHKRIEFIEKTGF